MSFMSFMRLAMIATAPCLAGVPTMSFADPAYLEITLDVAATNRATAGAIYEKYRDPFLKTVPGALSKQLLIRDEDVQVLHGFDSVENANAYLATTLFSADIVGELTPLLQKAPEIRIYTGN